MLNRFFVGLVGLFAFAGAHASTGFAADPPAASGLFARKNLVAWCIVPFDSKKRGPEERAAMLEKLGFSQFAYDYRSEHIPTFDAEIEALKRHHVELTAWWFPTTLNDEAKMTLAVFQKHKVTPQLWVTGGGEPTKSEAEQQQRITAEAARIRPIAEAAAAVGCKVALYNHGGWCGEPENQIAVIQKLNLPNVGIVYNQHHGHDHLDRFPALLQKMKPYLLTLNLNGMVIQGDRKGQKILQLSQGDLDLSLLKVIRDSGYSGPIGILGHTQDDAEERLHDNLDGLDWLLPQLEGKAAGAKPKMRTPVPVAQTSAAAAVPAVVPKANVPHLAEGKFGKALDCRAGGAFVASRDEFHQFPITVECWTKLTERDPYNILVANELKSSGTHWELFSMAGSGNLTAYLPGYSPDHCHSSAMICDGKWHQVAMILEPERIRLFVDGQEVANQNHRRTERKSVASGLALGTLVEQSIGCTGLLDEVRISKGIRPFNAISEKAYTVDDATLSLWRFDELFDNKNLDDATWKSPAVVGVAASEASGAASRTKIEGHWGEEALGFRWTEQDSRDDRFGSMDTGPFFCGSITGAGGIVYKGIVVRLGSQRTASICYDTELARASAGWTGFVKFDPARFGIINPPRIEGDVTFTTPLLGGWTRSDQFSTFRESSKYGGLPKNEVHYAGLFRHGQRTILKWSIGTAGLDESTKVTPTVVLESPSLEEANGITALSRTFWIGPSTTVLSMLVSEPSSRVRLVAPGNGASLKSGPGQAHVLSIPAHSEPLSVKLFVAAPTVDEAAFEKLVAASSDISDLVAMTKPGPTIWGEPLVTVGEVSNIRSPLVIDTITLPFENPYRALMFCGGHDFLPDGRAVVCTLHGDMWLVDGLDDTLKRITWRRFATGLFQPLGVKVVAGNADKSKTGSVAIYVVGRDQITRLHDTNNDGEADFYENFNNDAYVSLNGHEYVTCLETDRAGNFYFMKGNCDSAIPHDGSLLRVSPDGAKLDVFATGFRNSNGMGIGPNDEITVAPQEGEWTPASAVFDVHQGGFYGAMMSHHKPTPPKDFVRPFSWFPRLADNSSGGQVWVPSGQWGPLSGQLLLLSYGQCELRLMLREPLPQLDASSSNSNKAQSAANAVLRRSPLAAMNGGSTELPLTFASGIHRGRFHPKDGHLYLTGLKGWVTSAVNDGCFQRVRYTGLPADYLIGMRTYRNGLALTFSRDLNRMEATNADNYQIEAWNYQWRAEYGSPDLRPSAPGQIGRDPVEPVSVTLLDDQRTVFIELSDLKPVDQVGLAYSLRAADGASVEQTAYLTLNGIPADSMSVDKLQRTKSDTDRAELHARLSPGVLLTAPFWKTAVQRRMLAWTDLSSPGGNGELTATGYVKVPATGEYHFNAVAEGAAKLEINGTAYPLGSQDAIVTLHKGYTRIRVVQAVGAKPSRFRLMWESDHFPREAIPASLLFHEKSTGSTDEHQHQIVAGQSLFEERKCANCHAPDSSGGKEIAANPSFEQLRQAPELQGIGNRLTSDWLTAWLRDPKHLRPDATMPQMLRESDSTKLTDLVAYLASLKDPNAGKTVASAKSDSELAAAEKTGERLFEQLGCIACHTLSADSQTEWNRVTLQFVKTKFQPGALEEYLLTPHRHQLGSHMPDFHLTQDEVTSLTAYLIRNTKGTLPVSSATQTVSIERGKLQFTELKCNRCHRISPTDELGIADIRLDVARANSHGCLADAEHAAGKAPAFKFSSDEIGALRAYLDARSKGVGPVEVLTVPPSARLLASLRCQACHARDASPATWPEVVVEEGSGRLPEPVPQLTWVGEKLQGGWIAKLIKGHLKEKPRPWLNARMPSFPAYADMIAKTFASEHGVAIDEPPLSDFQQERIEIGQRLTLRDGGLDCRQCHGIGKDLPKGDAATQIALGINFAMTRDRVRPEFALRQMLDPPRYDIGSRMPRFAPDLRTTAAKHIEGGDARKQFEAIKQYLWSLNLDVDGHAKSTN